MCFEQPPCDKCNMTCFCEDPRVTSVFELIGHATPDGSRVDTDTDS